MASASGMRKSRNDDKQKRRALDCGRGVAGRFRQ